MALSAYGAFEILGAKRNKLLGKRKKRLPACADKISGASSSPSAKPTDKTCQAVCHRFLYRVKKHSGDFSGTYSISLFNTTN
jgi:hypothetical protein